MSRKRNNQSKDTGFQPADKGRVLAAGSGTPGANMVYATNAAAEKPSKTNFVNVIQRCKYYGEESMYLGSVLKLKKAVLNYGLRLVEKTGAPESAEGDTENEELTDWLQTITPPKVDQVVDTATNETIQVESTTTNSEEILAFIDSVWRHWLLYENVVTLWRDTAPYALVLDLEKCEYKNTLGIETLRYKHGLGLTERQRLSPEDQARFSKPNIFLHPGTKEHFKVLKRSDEGTGFGLPYLYRLITTLGQVESMECGLHTMAHAMRTVRRHHRIGHAIESGPHAGKPTHFWTKKRANATKLLWNNKTGFDEFIANFDHDIEFPWPDLTVFDQKVFNGVDERINRWIGPIGQMLTQSTASPYLSQMLKADGLAERSKIKAFLESVINLAWAPPVPIKVSWSNLIFNSDKLAQEFTKFGFDRGMLSTETAREEMGADNELENERKKKEVEDPDFAAKRLPNWDDSHGISPARGDTLEKDKGDGSGGEGEGGENPNSGREPGSTKE
jgi:hypothetical protein